MISVALNPEKQVTRNFFLYCCVLSIIKSIKIKIDSKSFKKVSLFQIPENGATRHLTHFMLKKTLLFFTFLWRNITTAIVANMNYAIVRDMMVIVQFISIYLFAYVNFMWL